MADNKWSRRESTDEPLQMYKQDHIFSQGGITKGVEGKEGNPGDPCLDSWIL